MKTFHILLSAIGFCAAAGLSAPLVMASAHDHITNETGTLGTIMPEKFDVSMFPAPAAGMEQFIINMPPEADEQSLRIGVTVGQMRQTDGVNRTSLGGQLTEKNLQGWGYSYYEYQGHKHSMSTLIGVPPGKAPVTKFVNNQETLLRYNSRMPVVIYAPQDYEVRYRIFRAGPSQRAQANKSQPAIASPSTVWLDVDQPIVFPQGAIATVRLYDALLMDTNPIYGEADVFIKKLPTQVDLPAANPTRKVAGPAVSVSVRDHNGRLLYRYDRATRLIPGQQPRVWLKKHFR